ncbi:MAG: MBL fold metallo-hydrolase [Desulfobacteraceae bacterium]|nr:MBL fold metallo-hydrolase [Desulfobacteraceae bacterium]
MSGVVVRFLGSGDAFGSGGRLQACTLVQMEGKGFLVDCGASSLVAMKRVGVETSAFDTIFLTHLHGDHFGGIPFLLLNEHLLTKRTSPLLIAGPAGVEERVRAAMEVFFPGSSKIPLRFSLQFHEWREKTPERIGEAVVTPFEVIHASGAPSYALRIECGGKVLGFSGDTEWTDSILGAASGADLFVCEAYFWSRKTKYHMDYASIRENRDRLGCARIVLTHMSEDVLSKLDEAGVEFAEDGKAFFLD